MPHVLSSPSAFEPIMGYPAPASREARNPRLEIRNVLITAKAIPTSRGPQYAVRAGLQDLESESGRGARRRPPWLQREGMGHPQPASRETRSTKSETRRDSRLSTVLIPSGVEGARPSIAPREEADRFRPSSRRGSNRRCRTRARADDACRSPSTMARLDVRSGTRGRLDLQPRPG